MSLTPNRHVKDGIVRSAAHTSGGIRRLGLSRNTSPIQLNSSPKISEECHTSGGINKALLTPCRRLGLSRNIRSQNSSPIQLNSSPKISEECHTSGGINKALLTPCRRLGLSRYITPRKSSPIQLNSSPKISEECGSSSGICTTPVISKHMKERNVNLFTNDEATKNLYTPKKADSELISVATITRTLKSRKMGLSRKIRTPKSSPLQLEHSLIIPFGSKECVSSISICTTPLINKHINEMNINLFSKLEANDDASTSTIEVKEPIFKEIIHAQSVLHVGGDKTECKNTKFNDKLEDIQQKIKTDETVTKRAEVKLEEKSKNRKAANSKVKSRKREAMLNSTSTDNMDLTRNKSEIGANDVKCKSANTLEFSPVVRLIVDPSVEAHLCTIKDNVQQVTPVQIIKPHCQKTKLRKRLSLKRNLSTEPASQDYSIYPTISLEHSVQNDCSTLELQEKITKRIKEKTEHLETLQRSEQYRRLHNVEELANITNIWKNVCILALRDLLKHLQQHCNIDMPALIMKLNIPGQTLYYDNENDIFT